MKKLLKATFVAIVVLLTTPLVKAADLTGTFVNRASINYAELDQPLKKSLDKELKCLADNIYYEAGSEPFEGKVAVAMVSINRAESGRFPDTICGVVSQRTKVTRIEQDKPVTKIICQFSWFCEKKRSPNSSKWDDAMEVAKMVLLEGYRIPTLEGAMYFHAVHVRPGWKLPRVAKVGNHVFYEDRTPKLVEF